MTRLWPKLLGGVQVVQPETILRWHRAGFKAFWRWKSRCRRGRPRIDRELRDLIRRMSQENPLWGAPRIHGELLKLGFEVAQSTVSKYVVRRQTPPSQTWKTLRFSFWGTDGGSCCGLRSPDIRRPSGWLSRSPRPFPGVQRRPICCETMIARTEMSLRVASSLWVSVTGPSHGIHRGKMAMLNA